MKRIVVCFDGTWNKPADENLPLDIQVETNVRRFYESISDNGPDGTSQLKWYDEGVGADWYDKFVGGAFGAGLDLKIIEGYKFLAGHYEDGDEVYVLGFSRGAYTARSLVGMIRNCGLVKNKRLDLGVGMAYRIYRTRDDGVDSRTARRFRSMFSREIRITFVGVWDTVADSYAGFPKGHYAKIHPRHFRSIGGTEFGNETVNESVEKRRRGDANYTPQNSGLPVLG